MHYCLLQVVLSCNRMPSGEVFDCETQTLHFSRVSGSTVVMMPDPNTTETIKVEFDTDHPERNMALGSEVGFMSITDLAIKQHLLQSLSTA